MLVLAMQFSRSAVFDMNTGESCRTVFIENTARQVAPSKRNRGKVGLDGGGIRLNTHLAE